MRGLIIVVFVFIESISLIAQDHIDCWAGARKAVRKEMSGFLLRLSPLSEKENIATGYGCRAEIVGPKHKVIFSAADWGFSILVDGKDVDGDGNPDLVLESDSGGMHGTSTYYAFTDPRDAEQGKGK